MGGGAKAPLRYYMYSEESARSDRVGTRCLSRNSLSVHHTRPPVYKNIIGTFVSFSLSGALSLTMLHLAEEVVWYTSLLLACCSTKGEINNTLALGFDHIKTTTDPLVLTHCMPSLIFRRARHSRGAAPHTIY